MAGKTAIKASRPVLKRKLISLGEKVSILDRLKNGERSGDIAKTLNLNESTVRTIKRNEQKIRESVCAGSLVSAKRVARVRDVLMEKMEESLMVWIECCGQQNIALDGTAIRQKAYKIYANLKGLAKMSKEPIREFCASKGWFENFKKRFSLFDIKSHGECGSTDADAKSTNSDFVEPTEQFLLAKLQKGLELTRQVANYFKENDPLLERYETFHKQFEICLLPYLELEKELEQVSKHLTIINDLAKTAANKEGGSTVFNCRESDRIDIIDETNKIDCSIVKTEITDDTDDDEPVSGIVKTEIMEQQQQQQQQQAPPPRPPSQPPPHEQIACHIVKTELIEDANDHRTSNNTMATVTSQVHGLCDIVPIHGRFRRKRPQYKRYGVDRYNGRI